MLLISVLTANCSGNEEYTPAVTDPTSVIRGGSDPGSAEVNTTDPLAKEMIALYPGDRLVPATPEEERNMVISDMQSFRIILLADLAVVRARLNVGTQPEAQRKVDQDIAAELAQGLERVDRALVALDASVQANWPAMRKAQLKEVKEVRAWMVGYRAKPALHF